MQIVYLGDNLYEMTKPVSWEKYEKKKKKKKKKIF